MKKRGLGKGLEALLGDDVTETSSTIAQMVDIEKLIPNPYQPRKFFDEQALGALVDSIVQHGVIQPLAVRPKGKDYEIIAGERRYRAAKVAGLTEVPVIVHDVSDSDSAIFALIENIQREDLNVIDKAKGIRSLIENFNLTHDACGKVLGQSRSAISNTLRLLELDESVQQAVIDKVVDMGHARALLGVEKSEQHELLEKIRLNGLSVREAELLVKERSQPEKAPLRFRKNAETRQLEACLSELLQTKVSVSRQASGGGKLTLSFSDEGALQKLTRRLGLD